MEMGAHVDPTAWDARSIWARISVDLRRDFLSALTNPDEDGGGTLSLPSDQAPLDLARDKLAGLAEAIDGFSDLLRLSGDDSEESFHAYIAKYPILLDVYGDAESKPRFHYPEGQSLLGKMYVEPDFIVRLPGGRYRLVELERPSKDLATQTGQPRAGVTQAAFQIAEWKDFINNHYEVVKDRYPGISSRPWTQVVIGRAHLPQLGGVDVDRYLAVVREQLAVDEVITYDDLLQRARGAYTRLAALITEGP